MLMYKRGYSASLNTSRKHIIKSVCERPAAFQTHLESYAVMHIVVVLHGCTLLDNSNLHRTLHVHHHTYHHDHFVL